MRQRTQIHSLASYRTDFERICNFFVLCSLYVWRSDSKYFINLPHFRYTKLFENVHQLPTPLYKLLNQYIFNIFFPQFYQSIGHIFWIWN